MTIKITISGMTCGHCVASVEKALTETPGVTRVVEVSKDRGEALVEGPASGEDLIAAIADAGYEAIVVA